VPTVTDLPEFSDLAFAPDAPKSVDPDLSLTLPVRRARGLRQHVVRSIVAVVGVGLVGLTLLLATAPPTTVYEAYSPLVGHRAPAIVGTTLIGQPFNLHALRGHFVVIDFFSSWCVPCRTEQPQLVRFAEHPYGGAQLVGVVFQDLNASALAMLGPWRGLYPVLGDPEGRYALSYGVDNPPSKYVIDPKGRVVAKIIGPVTAVGLDSLLKRAIAQGL
jgi:cytochrome c biogenesis protein CcmG/thiol:disulfide interchange protein DsbE